jgi:hypothetical protein
MWMWFGDTIANIPVAAVWASFWATCMALPFDNIKTKLQKQFSDPAKNRIHYNGFINCYRTTFIVEGWQGFIVGFYAFYFKILLLTLMVIHPPTFSSSHLIFNRPFTQATLSWGIGRGKLGSLNTKFKQRNVFEQKSS